MVKSCGQKDPKIGHKQHRFQHRNLGSDTGFFIRDSDLAAVHVDFLEDLQVRLHSGLNIATSCFSLGSKNIWNVVIDELWLYICYKNLSVYCC